MEAMSSEEIQNLTVSGLQTQTTAEHVFPVSPEAKSDKCNVANTFIPE